ncbi:hypothetical protein CKO31_18285 [Thiohalocapsa halophila]|uniref:Uncharacterized protein n=1 Tax=Thiohalocapsa halophila TaxID=69359 RepID=A0ABS1CL45_9GAMM|nr:hypothetical protein [Thiohalocapsa halophila]MBK1632655.1 hypothetical protein [Thiohalocapsa halophila]
MSMIQYAFSNTIYNLNAQAPLSSDVLYTFPSASIKSITAIYKNAMYFLARTDPHEVDYRTIYKLDLSSDPPKEIFLFEHHAQICNLEIRLVAGVPRLYFSAHTTPDWGSPIAIYQLTGNNYPLLYCDTEGFNLPLPNPCSEGEWDGGWRGNFAFAGASTLFLSSGNVVPSGLYKISGAGAAGVTGSPTRMFVRSDGGIWGLACISETELFFHGNDAIYHLDLENAGTLTVIAQDLANPYNSISDVATDLPVSAWQLKLPWRFFALIPYFFSNFISKIGRLLAGRAIR